MINIPPLTPQLLDELRQELGGCDFTGRDQQSFLSAATSCDVQAAPGNGKTTLLVAKLLLLSRSWTSRAQGVCVISHTNAAREEIERKLCAHPSASAFLSYPHFIGTVTAFIDRFIALPYLRGFGWYVQQIDDDVFAAVARSRWRLKPALVAYSRIGSGANLHALEEYVSELELASNFECGVGTTPTSLQIRHRRRQPGPQSPTGIALGELKAEITNDGFYRFGDLTAMAHQAIERTQGLVERIRSRFPLVLLDEAQDTNGAHLALLDRLFGEGTSYQRLGDQNQTLYEDDELTPNDYWRARDGVIPLNDTRRFGVEIATFASRLTARAAQQIEGMVGVPSRRTLILFDRNSIANVLPSYAGEVRAHLGETLTPQHEIWAVASRHNPAGARGDWPKTLIDYYPEYKSGKSRRDRPVTLCSCLRHAAILYERHSPPQEVSGVLTAGILELLRCQGVRDSLGRLVNLRTLWDVLATRDPCAPLKLKRLIRDRVLLGHAVWDAAAWGGFCRECDALLGFDQRLTPRAVAYLAFVEDGAVHLGDHGRERSRTLFLHEGMSIKLGSIHAVKGKTVDSILVVETEIWRGQRRTMDLATVLPHAFGLENRDFGANAVQLAAATNIFVAVTRPRQILSCALRKEAATNDLVGAARAQGWHLVDLTLAR